MTKSSTVNIYRFDADVGRSIDNFGSVNFILSRIAQLTAQARVSCFHLGAKGKVGYHQAVTPQLFLVVQGEGWVRDKTSGRGPIKMGYAVFWDSGEWHESGTDAGMIAIVIESQVINPAEFMPAGPVGKTSQNAARSARLPAPTHRWVSHCPG